MKPLRISLAFDYSKDEIENYARVFAFKHPTLAFYVKDILEAEDVNLNSMDGRRLNQLKFGLLELAFAHIIENAIKKEENADKI